MRLQEIVESRQVARLEELSAALGVSLATVRRDLIQLAGEGKLHRVYGGAASIVERSRFDVRFADAAAEAAEEKERIAARAIQFLSPEETVYLDSGSTVLAVARMLRGWERLTVVTNSLPVATELLGRGPQVIVVGGQLRVTSEALVGPLTRFLLSELRFDTALVGTFALSLEDGLMTTDPGEAFTRELVLGRSRQVILLADSRKVGTSSVVHAGRLEAVDILVTDVGIADGAVRTLERRGIEVIRV
jgi:DeoR/GlpR family transcriptional regulator of sugar metabolism